MPGVRKQEGVNMTPAERAAQERKAQGLPTHVAEAKVLSAVANLVRVSK